MRALLAGKVAALVLAFGQIALIARRGRAVALRAGGDGDPAALIGPAIGWFVPFFVLGFVMLAALWAVVGALVSRQEDLGSSSTLVQMLVMVPFFAVMFLPGQRPGHDGAVVHAVLGPGRDAGAAVPRRPAAWEPLLSLGVLAVTVVVCVLVAGRLYKGSLLQTGARVRLRRAWSGAGTQAP